jgi:hypothetical protein
LQSELLRRQDEEQRHAALLAESLQRRLISDLFVLDDTDAADLAIVLPQQRRGLGQVGRDDDGQPVLIVEHEVEKLGHHLLWLALLQHDQGQFLVPHLRRFSRCHASVLFPVIESGSER